MAMGLAFLYLLITYFFYAAVIFISLYRISRYKKKEMAILLIFAALGLISFILYGASLQAILLLIPGLLLFNGLLVHSKDRRLALVYVILSLAYILFTYTIGIVLIAQALLFGMLGSISSLKEPKFRLSTKNIEINRDFVHIGAGIVLMICFAFLAVGVARLILMLMIVFGILVIRYAELSKGKGIFGIAYSLERNGARLGHGALWLALGSLLAISFLKSPAILVVFAAEFIGDPLATIVGIKLGGPKLPYSKSKSWAGSLAYFISTAAIASPFIGIWAIPIGFIGAAVESIDFGIDDNFTAALALTAILAVAQIGLL